MLEANMKYLAACTEISTRLLSRELVLLVFVAFTAVAVALALSTDASVEYTLPIGYATLATSLLCRHHDMVIANLRRFQHDLSQHDTDENSTPEYTSLGYLGRAIEEGSKRVYAQLLIMAMGGIASFCPVGRVMSSPFSMSTILWYGSILCSLFAINITLKTERDRKRWAA